MHISNDSLFDYKVLLDASLRQQPVIEFWNSLKSCRKRSDTWMPVVHGLKDKPGTEVLFLSYLLHRFVLRIACLPTQVCAESLYTNVESGTRVRLCLRVSTFAPSYYRYIHIKVRLNDLISVFWIETTMRRRMEWSNRIFPRRKAESEAISTRVVSQGDNQPAHLLDNRTIYHVRSSFLLFYSSLVDSGRCWFDNTRRCPPQNLNQSRMTPRISWTG